MYLGWYIVYIKNECLFVFSAPSPHFGSVLWHSCSIDGFCADFEIYLHAFFFCHWHFTVFIHKNIRNRIFFSTISIFYVHILVFIYPLWLWKEFATSLTHSHSFKTKHKRKIHNKKPNKDHMLSIFRIPKRISIVFNIVVRNAVAYWRFKKTIKIFRLQFGWNAFDNETSLSHFPIKICRW